MSEEIKVVTAPVVELLVSSTVSSFASNKRYAKDLTVGQLKGKLELVTGAGSSTMTLEVFNKENVLVCKLEEDSRLLGSYQIDDGMRLHVTDRTHSAGDYEDVSKVQKFELTDEEYNKRTDSVKAFKERNKMGRFNPELVAKKEAETAAKEAVEEEKARSISVDNRCEVRVTGQPARRGTVKYVGGVDFKPGAWVGVQYDEPMGKNNGSVQGKQYFTCPDKYGGFVRPSQVEVGDFPEEGFSDEDMEL